MAPALHRRHQLPSTGSTMAQPRTAPGSLGVVVRPARRPIGRPRSRTARGARGAASARCGAGRRPIAVRRRTSSAARRGGRSDRPATRSQVDRRARPPAPLAAASQARHPPRRGSLLDANMVSHHSLPPAHPLGAGRPALSGTDQAGSVGQLPVQPGRNPRSGRHAKTDRITDEQGHHRHLFDPLGEPPRCRPGPSHGRSTPSRDRPPDGQRHGRQPIRGDDLHFRRPSARGRWPRGYRPPGWIGTWPASACRADRRPAASPRSRSLLSALSQGCGAGRGRFWGRLAVVTRRGSGVGTKVGDPAVAEVLPRHCRVRVAEGKDRRCSARND